MIVIIPLEIRPSMSRLRLYIHAILYFVHVDCSARQLCLCEYSVV